MSPLQRAMYRVKNKMRVGAKLMCMHSQTGKQWYLIPGGAVQTNVAEALIKEDDVASGRDGMFGDQQTWSIR
jgi:hypothetical protein